ncbi:MAG: agmatinase family protein [Dehalococcoidia bacterium]
MAVAQREYINYHVGFPSFFKAPIIGLEEIKEGMPVIAGVPIDQGINIGRTGARLGPRGIREASYKYRGVQEAAEDRTTVDIDHGVGLRFKGDEALGDIGDLNTSPQDIMQTTEWVASGVCEIVKRGGLPVVLGGDHYVAYPSFEGFARGQIERKPNPRLGYVHIDSHPDFWDEQGVGGRYSHATSARRISESSTISYQNMAWLGLNGAVLDAEQYRMYRTHKLKMLTARMLLERGIEEAVQQVMEAAADSADAVYVSIDIDVVDGSESPGTTACVYQGISARNFLHLMSVLSCYDVIQGIDLCEISPPIDPTGRTVHLAALGLLSILGPRLFEAVDMDSGEEKAYQGFTY